MIQDAIWLRKLNRQIGADEQRERSVTALIAYLDLSKEPDEDGVVTENPEWDSGFQAAISIISRYK
jgi:hypothetical protein